MFSNKIGLFVLGLIWHAHQSDICSFETCTLYANIHAVLKQSSVKIVEYNIICVVFVYLIRELHNKYPRCMYILLKTKYHSCSHTCQVRGRTLTRGYTCSIQDKNYRINHSRNQYKCRIFNVIKHVHCLGVLYWSFGRVAADRRALCLSHL